MSSNAEAVIKYNDAIAEVSGGVKDLKDFIFQYSYKLNSGDFLQPAPMAIAVLGNLSIVASTVDFKLITPKDGFKQVQYPDSFRATINQLVNAGAIALQKSYTNFDEIQKRCAGVRRDVNNIFAILSGESFDNETGMNDDIRRFLPTQIPLLQRSVGTCLLKAQETEFVFKDLLNLTMEVHESLTATQGDTSTKIQDAKMRESILAQQKDTREKNEKLSAQQQADARRSLDDAQKQFNKAADDMPTGWDLVGTQFVEGLSTAVLVTLNAGVNKYVAESQNSTQQQNSAINAAGGVPSQSGPSVIPQNVSDPGYQKAQTIRTNALALDALATGGANKSVDWAKVTTEGGARWIKSSFDVALGGTWTTDPASVEAKALISSGSQLAQQLADLAPNAGNAAAVDPVVNSINQFVLDALKFATTSLQKTGTTPVQNAGFAAPTNSPNLSSESASLMAVNNTQFKLEVTQQQSDFSRKMSQDSTDKLLQVTESLGQVLGQVAQLKLEQIDWSEVRIVLLRIMSFLCQLKGCLADIVQILDAVNNLISGIMTDICGQYITLISDTTKAKKSVGGVTLSSWMRQVIFDQAMGAAKVTKLVEKISTIYVTVYDQHVQEGVKKLLPMGQWLGGDASNKGQLQKASRELQTWAHGASTGITDLIRNEQAKMEADIEARMSELQTAINGILPPPSPAIKAAITEAMQASITEVSDAITAADVNKPVWKPELGKKL